MTEMRAQFDRLYILAACLCIPMICTTVQATASDRVKINAQSPFLIDRTEVTIARFKAFVSTGGLKTKAERDGGGMEYSGGWQKRSGWTWRTPYGTLGKPDEPVAHLTSQEAQQFCKHAGGRLPSAKEWRLAAYTESREQATGGYRRGKTYTYPVGNSPEGMNNSRKRHVIAGSTRRGVNGLYDMGANVWEWLADRRGDEALTIGDSWWYSAEMTQSSRAQYKPANFAAIYIGFRCVYDSE